MMNTYKKFYFLLILLLIAVTGFGQTGKKTYLTDLRCCRFVNPEGIIFPELSWKIKTTEQGVSQSAWEVEIASSEKTLKNGKADIWKSCKQISDKQFDIKPYEVDFAETTRYFWRVRIWDDHGNISNWSHPAFFSIGILKEQSWKGKWMTYPYKKDRALPYFRKEFQLKKGVTLSGAIVYFCGLGAGELYLNGKKADPTRFLDPAETNYDSYALYSTFDVTDMLKKDNCIGVMLGNGWFSQDKGWKGGVECYGSPMFRLHLVLRYSDGSRTEIGSDETWKWKEGPIIMSNLYLGERYDARNEISGWNLSGFDDNRWEKALYAKNGVPPILVPQMINPIRTFKKLKALKMWQDPSGKWIFDFGKNVTGVSCLQIVQPAGTKLTIRMSEEKKHDGSLDFTSMGWIHHGRIFANEYICKGQGKEFWYPRFSYHGFRYAELSGLKGKPNLSTVGLIMVHSALDNTGFFKCSNQQINHLHELAVRTVLNNIHGIPTDCPDREKCGWLGDSHAYVKMANLNFRMNNFWTKFLGDIRSGSRLKEKKTLFHERYNNTFYFVPKPSGLPYMIAPGKRLCGVASPDWGTALVQLPWWLYVYCGNSEILKDYYSAMKQWTDHVSALAMDTARTGKYNINTKHIVYQGLGDWCPPGGNSGIDTPVEFSSTAFYYQDVCIMERTARLLGKTDDIEKYKKEKKAISNEIISVMYNDSDKTFGSQTADVMALDFGLVPQGDENAVANSVFRNMKEKSNGFMHCGIFGIGRIGSMLARNGEVEVAWNMFTKKGENSFAWMWEMADATSLWETLPVSAESEKVASSGSLDHPMQAGYDICFYEDIAGIRPDALGYGFKVIRFEPLFSDYLSWAKASIESPYGKVSSSWKKEGNKFKWQIVIPANSSGLVALSRDKDITVNGIKFNTDKYPFVCSDNGKNLYHFTSGNFSIQVFNK
ncbi:MAG: family 78 glycoside hydrolase catalytic domain [Prolixibacteraceae bacterium]|nr:family 78 glycoside hydrolase catalytic domain [Prolixibacteraceae bacterium]